MRQAGYIVGTMVVGSVLGALLGVVWGFAAQEDGPVRHLYQGILQIGVGFHHLANGNAYGARRLWQRGIDLLEPFRDGCMNVDVDRLIRDTELCLAEMERTGVTGTHEFPTELIPRVQWLAEREPGAGSRQPKG